MTEKAKKPAKPTELATREFSSVNSALTAYSRVGDQLAFCKEMATSYAAITGSPVVYGPAIVMTCVCEGLTALDFMKRYHIIQGKPSMRTDAMLAEFSMNWDGEYKIIENSPWMAKVVFKTAGGEAYERSMSAKELLLSRWPWSGTPGWKACVKKAQAMFDAGKTEQEVWREMFPNFKDNYGTQADWQNMLWVRMVSSSLRVVCPGLVAGVYTPEETADFMIESEVTNKTVVLDSQVIEPQAQASPTQAAPQSSAQPSVQETMQPPSQESAPRKTARQLAEEAAKREAERLAEEQKSDQATQDSAQPEQPPAKAEVKTEVKTEAIALVGPEDADRIAELFASLNVPAEKQAESLAKRGVDAINKLSASDAAEILGRLTSLHERKLAEKKALDTANAAGKEPVKEAPEADPKTDPKAETQPGK